MKKIRKFNKNILEIGVYNKMKILIKFNKIIDYIKSKSLMMFAQKIYKGNKYNIKYLLKKNPHSKDLLIIFTACTPPRKKARYNYIRTLDKFKCNKLFILDDFGYDSRGAYYLGFNKDFQIEKDVNSLINKIIKNLCVKNKFFIGSSKGGYAALYFGLEFKNSIIISGAPQYMLGNYLTYPNHKHILKYIMGDCSYNSINILNDLMKNKLINSQKNTNKIHLHYSNKEETYESDISLLINKLESLNFETYYHVKDYTNHSDLTNYFPEFITSTLLSYKIK